MLTGFCDPNWCGFDGKKQPSDLSGAREQTSQTASWLPQHGSTKPEIQFWAICFLDAPE